MKKKYDCTRLELPTKEEEVKMLDENRAKEIVRTLLNEYKEEIDKITIKREALKAYLFRMD